MKRLDFLFSIFGLGGIGKMTKPVSFDEDFATYVIDSHLGQRIISLKRVDNKFIHSVQYQKALSNNQRSAESISIFDDVESAKKLFNTWKIYYDGLKSASFSTKE